MRLKASSWTASSGKLAVRLTQTEDQATLIRLQIKLYIDPAAVHVHKILTAQYASMPQAACKTQACGTVRCFVTELPNSVEENNHCNGGTGRCPYCGWHTLKLPLRFLWLLLCGWWHPNMNHRGSRPKWTRVSHTSICAMPVLNGRHSLALGGRYSSI